MTTNNSTTTGGGREKAVHGIRGAVAGLHGTGEAIRGTFNQAVDETFGDPVGSRKNEAIADQGLSEINQSKLEKRNMDAVPTSTGTGVGAGTGTGTGTRTGTYGATGAGTGAGTGTYSTPGSGTTAAGTGTMGSTTAGPHSSSLANKLDPRVDSDLSNRGSTATTATGSTGYGTGHTGTGYGTGQTGAGYGAGQTGTGYGSTNAGPHDSNTLNKLDPRVDSDQDGRAKGAGGYGPTGTEAARDGIANYNNPASTNYGPHTSNLANKLDPRVDSDRDNRAGRTY